MKALQLLLVLGVALSVSACDSSHDDQVRRAYITQISVNFAPLLKPNGDRWDVFLGVPSGPDIFVEVEGSSGVTLLSTRNIVDADGNSIGTAQDVGENNFPLVFRFPDVRETEFNDLDRVLQIELLDADIVGPSEGMVTTRTFTLNDFAPATAGRTSNFQIESADGTAQVQLTVDWEN